MPEDHRCRGEGCNVCESQILAREDHEAGRDRELDYNKAMDWNWVPGMPY